uniref:Uncharacterized protein n=1 Tax=Pyxicephalus adspersus TaxID=30357 RepID=A0AAV3ASM4_PYXAD|nr:TPA: hypothetical protein GDO54_007960 [Pyxicephalus adspersus]
MTPVVPPNTKANVLSSHLSIWLPWVTVSQHPLVNPKSTVMSSLGPGLQEKGSYWPSCSHINMTTNEIPVGRVAMGDSCGSSAGLCL